jgi:hypothetical protein
MATVELEMARVRTGAPSVRSVRPYWEAGTLDSIEESAGKLIESATERLYVSGHAEHLANLGGGLLAADRRGVKIDVLCFGPPPFELPHGAVVRHSSTDGIVYSHHQARHLAVVGDNKNALWALARDGDDWQAVWAENDGLFSALVKGFVRHDLFVQKAFRDFRGEFIDRYGSGLEGLFSSSVFGADNSVERDDENLAGIDELASRPA